MSTLTKHAFFASLIPLAAAMPLQAASVLVNDTFDIGSPPTVGNDPEDPLDVAWQPNRGTLSVVNDSAGIGTGNAMQNASSAGLSFLNTWANFDQVTLANVGDRLILNLDFRFTNAPQDGGNAIRFGLGDGSSVTYLMRFGSGTSTGATVARNPNVGNGGTGGMGAVTLGDAGTFAVNDLLPRNYTLELVRTATGLNVSGAVGATVFAEGVDTSNPVYTFSQIQLGSGGISNSFRYDNINVTFVPIPEPASAAGLLGLAGVGLLARRRKTN